jgi:hypothetical protein
VSDRLHDHLEVILSRWQGEDIRRREAPLPVWDIRWPSLFARNRRRRKDAVAACRAELLTALLRSGGPVFLTHGEPPGSCEIPGDWRPAGPQTWLVPRDFEPQQPDARYWLFHLGGWGLYAAPASAAERWPDALRCRAGELLAWTAAHSVQTLITSYPDDTDWVVASDAP